MLETSARLLRLLALLQTRRDWNGPQLAERARRDHAHRPQGRRPAARARLPGERARPGVAGGYRLGAGTSLPPLLLDDEEAVAVAVGLRTAAASGGVAGHRGDLAARARQARAGAAGAPAPPGQRAARRDGRDRAAARPPVPAAHLTAIAAAIRDHERLRFDYEDHGGRGALRTVEPHRLVHTRGRWYLVAWDVDRDDWRTFRADRMQPRAGAGARFTPRPDPDGDLVGYVERGVGSAMWRHRARVKVHAPAAAVIARVPPAVIVEEIDDAHLLRQRRLGLRARPRDVAGAARRGLRRRPRPRARARAPPARRAPGRAAGCSRNGRFRGVGWSC